MNALNEYIDELVKGKEDTFEFPKNESSWEELFNFGKARIQDIVSLRAQNEAQAATIEKLREALQKMCKNLQWNMDNNPEIYNESDVKELFFALELLKETEQK